ncbi:serine O-acetyltransferase [Dyella agri]|uniref:Serine acetyltransferase n=1 Tax=Dyella agri TaxID=1926869 RepID=A0ABW8KBT0_9GAMM
MFDYIRSDLSAITNRASGFRAFRAALCTHTFHMTVLIRFGCWSRSRLGAPGNVIGAITEYLIRVVYASDISCKAKIGRYFHVMHGQDIVIGSEVVIGEHCKVFNSVTFGNKDTEDPSGNAQPKVGDNCVIGTGAKLLGGISIGDNVRIGANAVVLRDVPSNTVAVGVPARVITHTSTSTTARA